MGTNYAPLVADLFLFCYERYFMTSLSDDNQVVNIIEPFKVVRNVTFPNYQNWHRIKIFIYSYNTIHQPRRSRIEKRQCDVIMTSLAPQKDHPKNDVFDRFSGIKVSKNFRFFSKKHTRRRKKYSAFNGC